MSNPSVTREECEAAFDESLGNIHAAALTLQMHGHTEVALILAKAHENIQTNIIALLDSSEQTIQQYRTLEALLEQAKEAELSLRAEIRDEEQYHDAAYSKLNNKLEQTIQAAEKLAEALKNIADGDVIPYANIANAALAQYAARRGK